MKCFATGIMLFGAVLTMGQNPGSVGQFNVRNFDGKQYGGTPQNWDVVQNRDHLLYFANNSGVREFNGESWTRFNMPNNRQPRSLYRSAAGDVYIGGVGCFGILSYDQFGKPTCTKIAVPDSSIEFDDVWKIHELNGKIAFVSKSHIFLYSPDTKATEVIPAPENARIEESSSYKDQLFLAIETEEVTVGILDNGGIRIISRENISPVEILFIQGRPLLIDKTGKLYNVNQKGGDFKFELRSERIGPAEGVKINDVAISEEIIAVAISGRGVYLYDTDLRFIRILEEDDGLENLEVRKAYFDQYGNLWLCNDNGISYVETSSAVTYFDKKSGVTGITEDILIHDRKVNLATHSDLFQADLSTSSPRFENMNIVGMDVFQIRHFTFSDGSSRIFAIINDGITELSSEFELMNIIRGVYAWDLYQSVSNPDHVFIGLDGGGLASARYSNGAFIVEEPYANTAGEVRSVAELDGKIYYTVAFDGVFLLDTTRTQEKNKIPGLEPFADKSKEYKQFDMCVFDGRVFVGTTQGLYTVENGTLSPFKDFGKTFFEPELGIHRLIETGDGKMWLVMFRNVQKEAEEAEVGYLHKVDGKYEYVSAPFRPLGEDVIFSVTPASGGYYWFGGGSKVFVYNSGFKTHHDAPFDAFITQVEIEPDSTYLYQPRYSSVSNHQFDFGHNSITFEFSSSAYLGGITNEYSYFLEGEDTVWSKWSADNNAVYQRLSDGSYTFRVKARNYYGFESNEATIAFTILPPWYKTIWAWLMYIVLAGLFVYLVIRIAIRRVKKQNEKLEKIVEERTAEIAEQNQQLELQKTEIQEKSNDILDSIKYAKRIQNTILPDEAKLKEAFDFEHFVLYRPKDIVSGDFYWAQRFEDKTIFSAIDCTGHGVPGAFVSIVGHNGLNRAVNEFNLRKPSDILDKLADLVIANFSQTHSQIKDGMDIALCSLDNKTLKLEYAGANNPLVIVRDGEVIEIKANKQPIGEFAHRVPFKNHEIQLQKNDCVYIFSDGYADQFGGEKGKKLKLKNLKTFLEENYQLEMKSQHNELNWRLEKWMTGFEQLDDICIFGVKI